MAAGCASTLRSCTIAVALVPRRLVAATVSIPHNAAGLPVTLTAPASRHLHLRRRRRSRSVGQTVVMARRRPAAPRTSAASPGSSRCARRSAFELVRHLQRRPHGDGLQGELQRQLEPNMLAVARDLPVDDEHMGCGGIVGVRRRLGRHGRERRPLGSDPRREPPQRHRRGTRPRLLHGRILVLDLHPQQRHAAALVPAVAVAPRGRATLGSCKHPREPSAPRSTQ